MARIPGARKEDVPDDVRAVYEEQERSRGAPMPNTAIYALRPSIFRGHRALAAGIGESVLLPNELKNLATLRVALINGCPF
jgi:alkylhydroperoxidase family enzyme